MIYPDFEAEQWMTEYEQKAVHNLTDSSISALTFSELASLEPQLLQGLRLDYGEITGDHRLKREILSFYRDRDEETLTLTNGCLQANKDAMEVLLTPGDHVIVFTPGYQQYREVPLQLGCQVTELPLVQDEWTYPLELLEEALQPSTKLVVLNSPGNPTGCRLSTEQMKALAAMAEEHDFWILCDEVYMLPDEKHPSLADFSQRAVVTGSLSKTLGLSGLRLGWIKGRKEIIHAINVGRDYSFISTGPLRDVLAYIALKHKDELLRRSARIVERNKDITRNWLTGQSLFSCRIPEAGTVGFLKLPGLQNSKNFARALLEETGIFLLPGACFGYEEYFRLGFGQEHDRLEDVLKKLESFAAAWMAADHQTVNDREMM